jgi:hypothetical protein
MSLSDCAKCWDTPCHCGYEYRDYKIEFLIKMRDLFQRLIDERNAAQKGGGDV